MKPKNLRGHPQTARAQPRHSRAGIGGQQVCQLAEFAGEFLRLCVSAGTALCRALEPPHHDPQLATVELAGLVHGFKSPESGKTPHVPIDLAAQSRMARAGRLRQGNEAQPNMRRHAS